MITQTKNTINTPGPIQYFSITDNGIKGETAHASFKLTVYQEGLIRVQVTNEQTFSPNPYSVVSTPQVSHFEFKETDEYLLLNTKSIEVKIRRSNFSITFLDKSGTVLSEDDPNFGISWQGTEVSSYKKLQPWEKFVGLGEKTGGLNRWGKAYTNWNTDHFGYGNDADPLYISIPFYIGLHHERCYGIFFDNTHKTVFNFGASNNRYSYFSAEDGDMDYYFFHEKNVSEIISSYTSLTGKMEMPPMWALGFQQCRYSYYPDRDVIRLAETFRDKDIPADVIYLDIHYMEKYKVFTFDGENFPDPEAMIKTLKEKGFRIVVILDPGIKVEEGYAPYMEGRAKDLFLKYPDGSDYEGHVWPGWCTFPDFTNPETRAWWSEKMAFYTDLGVDGFWTDMNEPASWGQHTPNIVEFDYEGQKVSHRKGRNVYGMQMARSTQQGAKDLRENLRPFVLTRSGFAGIQRSAAVWTGDNVANDDHMLLGIRLVNSLGLSGVSFAGYDIGGFDGNTPPSLFARWISIAAFAPLFRSHTMINSTASEPWSFGEEVEEIARNYIKLRYKLLPLFYSAFYQSHLTGLPVAKSLAIDYPFDENIYKASYENQYLCCDSLLIKPVVSFKDVTKGYLPAGIWYYLYTDKLYFGNQEVYLDSPLSYLPVFVKGGAILTLQDSKQHTGQIEAGALYIHVYKGSGSTHFIHYEDSGDGYDFQEGAYFKREIVLNSDSHELSIGYAEGKLESKYANLTIFFHGFDQNNAVVAGEEKTLERKDVAFLKKLSDFDPLPSGKHPFHTCKEVPFMQIKHTNEPITIRLL
jgi:alpha-glucosidase